MKKIFLLIILLALFISVQVFTPLQAQEVKPKPADNDFSIIILDAKTDKPEKNFTPGDTVKFKCRYLLPPKDADTDGFFIKWQLSGPAGKISEGGEELSCFDKPTEISFAKYIVDKKDKFGAYTINIALYKGHKKLKEISDTFNVKDMIFSINNVYATDSLKSTNKKSIFMPGDPIVFVVDHMIDTGEKNAVKEVQFFTYNPGEKVVLELTNTNKFKAVSGHYASRFAKIIPKNLKSGTYTFMGKIVIGKKEVTSKITFEIKTPQATDSKEKP